MKIVAVIPARMASVRLAGKPLLKIHGLPMVEHVRRRVGLCKGIDRIVVATCDDSIATEVRRHGGDVVMTASTHLTGTDRAAEAIAGLNATHVLLVQGDEPLVRPGDLEKMVQAITSNPEGPVWNAVCPIEKTEDLQTASVVKCLLSKTNRILFFSRDFGRLPADQHPERFLQKVLGLIAYRADYLLRFASLAPMAYEKAASIEQMRVLEHGDGIYAVPFKAGYPGINTPEEVLLVERHLADHPEQRAILDSILQVSQKTR